MTEVAFHFNAPDRQVYACRLLRKAYLKGARVLVLADPPLAAAIDQQLWTMTGTEFVPHCLDAAAPSVRARSPILISSADAPANGPGDVLLNLRDSWPPGCEGFARVIEVVTADAGVRGAARERWKQYKAAGLEPQHLDLQKSSGAA